MSSEKRELCILDFTHDANNKKIKTYIGMPKVKAANVKLAYTSEMQLEIAKCANDILHYAENYFWHVKPGYGRKRIELYPYQKEILPSLVNERFNILLQSRQSGKCVDYNTHIIIRDKNSLEEKQIKIGKFFDRIKLSNKGKHSYINDSKFTETIFNNDFEVFTDTGWKTFDGIGKTKPFVKHYIKTKHHSIACADKHIFISVGKRQVFAKDLKVGDFIKTKKGIDEVVEIKILPDKKPMYDLLNVDGKKYFTNGLLSHNSTIVSLFCTWYALFNEDTTIIIVSKNKVAAGEVLDKIKMGIENLPFGLQQGVVEWNKSEIRFENNSKIIIRTTARGASADVLFIDETAYIRGWREFSQDTLPTITVSPTSKLILVSTPKGRNHFHSFWQKAIKPKDDPMWNGFIPWFVPWTLVPGRDEKWKQQTLKLLADEVGAAEAMAKFEQEFNCKFESTSGGLLRGDTLAWMSDISRDPLNIDDLYTGTLNKLSDYKRYTRMYAKVIKGHRYTIGIDGSTNIQEGNGDATSIIVNDVTELPFKQVCVINIYEGVNYREIPYIVYALGNYYNEAYIFTENNDGAGRETNRTLEDLGYDNLYWDNSVLAGFRTTKASKKQGCENLQLIADNHNYEIYDISVISQLGNFVKKKTSYGGMDDEMDDEVMGTIASLYFLRIQDGVMLQNILGDNNPLNNHHILFQKIINKNNSDGIPRSILSTQDVLDIMTRDESEIVQERIMKNMNIIDEPAKEVNKKFDIFDIMEKEIKEKENILMIDKDNDFIPF